MLLSNVGNESYISEVGRKGVSGSLCSYALDLQDLCSHRVMHMVFDSNLDAKKFVEALANVSPESNAESFIVSEGWKIQGEPFKRDILDGFTDDRGEIALIGTFYRPTAALLSKWVIRKFVIFKSRKLKFYSVRTMEQKGETIQITNIDFQLGNSSSIIAAGKNPTVAIPILMMNLETMDEVEFVFDFSEDAFVFVQAIGQVCRQSNAKTFMNFMGWLNVEGISTVRPSLIDAAVEGIDEEPLFLGIVLKKSAAHSWDRVGLKVLKTGSAYFSKRDAIPDSLCLLNIELKLGEETSIVSAGCLPDSAVGKLSKLFNLPIIIYIWITSRNERRR